MDARFQRAVAAVRSGDLERFKEALAADPALVTARSSRSHPQLLQCVVLDGCGKPNNAEMARLLLDAGASLDGQLVAAASIDNVRVMELLLAHGLPVDGDGGWSPLEEALYFHSHDALALLLEHGARVQNLRIAAGLGRTNNVAQYFAEDGSLKPEAGKIDWPFGSREWPQGRQEIVDNAFIYACKHGHVATAELLLQKGAAINAIPPGFDFAGTALHNAAINGHRAMVELLLERGADPTIKDAKIGALPASWAAHAGRTEIVELLQRAVNRRA